MKCSSVGDLKFQVKCFDRLREFRKKGGTILLVSHDLNTINTFCSRAYWLDQGRVMAEGEPREITASYYAALFNTGSKKGRSQPQPQLEELPEEVTASPEENTGDCGLRFPPPPDLSTLTEVMKKPVDFGDGTARIIDYGVYDSRGNRVQTTRYDETYYLNIRIIAMQDLTYYRVGYALRDNFGSFIYGTGSHTMQTELPRIQAGDIRDFYFKIRIPRVLFLPNHHRHCSKRRTLFRFASGLHFHEFTN